jgi:hypothetical protein
VAEGVVVAEEVTAEAEDAVGAVVDVGDKIVSGYTLKSSNKIAS